MGWTRSPRGLREEKEGGNCGACARAGMAAASVEAAAEDCRKRRREKFWVVMG